MPATKTEAMKQQIRDSSGGYYLTCDMPGAVLQEAGLRGRRMAPPAWGLRVKSGPAALEDNK